MGRKAAEPFTRAFPSLPAVRRRGEHWWVTVDGVEVRLSNLTKVFWPRDGITKGDLVAYYHNAAPWILPHLRERPLALKRMPEGVEGPSFFEDDAPTWTPEWVTRCAIESSDGEVDRLIVADSVAALLFVANSGAVDLHPFHSRCESYDRPDYLVFDLDPEPPATFADSLAVAALVGVALEELGLTGYAKTSGATGMQVYVPCAAWHSYEETRELAGRIGRVIMQADPKRVTMEWSVRARRGKVYIDHNMNRRAASLAAAYSLRPRRGAPVSMPLTWAEVHDGDVRPGDFTIENAFERLRAMGDPFAPVVSEPQDLGPALDALGVARVAPERSHRVRRLDTPARGGERRDEAAGA